MLKIKKINITRCNICYSYDLEFIKEFEHEDIMLNDYDLSTPPIMRKDEAIICKGCDAIYYIEDGRECCEFSPKRISETKLNWTSDYDVSINTKRLE